MGIFKRSESGFGSKKVRGSFKRRLSIKVAKLFNPKKVCTQFNILVSAEKLRQTQIILIL